MPNPDNSLDLNERIETAVSDGRIDVAQDLCDAHPGDVWPDLFWTVMAEVADLEASVIPFKDEAKRSVHERFDRSDLDSAVA